MTWLGVLLIACAAWPLGCVKTGSQAPGNLVGVVVDDGGSTISGVRVTAAGQSTITDLRGRWSLTDLPTQVVTVAVEREGYEPQSRNVEVRAGQTIEGVNFTLAGTGFVSSLNVSDLTSSSVTTRFTTRSPVVSYVEYGTNNLYGMRTPTLTASVGTHLHPIANLHPATTYHWRAVVWDRMGRLIQSGNQTFTTLTSRIAAPPANVRVVADSNSTSALLTWDPDTQGDLAGYRVYRSPTAAGPFELISETGLVPTARYLDNTLDPGRKVWYRVTRLAGTGLESAPSPTVSFVLPGQTRGNLVWSRDQNPIELTGDLLIAVDHSLTIGPGTIVRFAPTNARQLATGTDGRVTLAVQGSLAIDGSTGNEVVFTSAAGTPTRGDWHGIKFEKHSHLPNSRIRSLQLDFATRGIEGVAGVPVIENCRFRQCSDSGVYSASAGIDLRITGNTVEHCGTGITAVHAMAGRTLIASNTVRECGIGLVVRDNLVAQVQGNMVSRCQTHGIEIGNQTVQSLVSRNVVGPGASSIALVAYGRDEIRRNTLQGNVGIEIRGDAAATIRSNLLLANRWRAGVGVLYRGDSAYTTASQTIQANCVWDLPITGTRYIDANGTVIGVNSDVIEDPKLLGGDPFVDPPPESFDYHPAPRSPIKGQGYQGEDIGAFDVP